jgi:hypothetical protein
MKKEILLSLTNRKHSVSTDSFHDYSEHTENRSKNLTIAKKNVSEEGMSLNQFGK